MSSKFPIHWTMAQSRPSWSTEQHQGTQLNKISRGDLSLLKLFNNMIPCYLYYHMGSSSQVGAEAAGFQEDNWFQFLARGLGMLWESSERALFKDAAFRLQGYIIPESRRTWSVILVQLSEVLESMNKLWATRARQTFNRWRGGGAAENWWVQFYLSLLENLFAVGQTVSLDI